MENYGGKLIELDAKINEIQATLRAVLEERAQLIKHFSMPSMPIEDNNGKRSVDNNKRQEDISHENTEELTSVLEDGEFKNEEYILCKSEEEQETAPDWDWEEEESVNSSATSSDSCHISTSTQKYSLRSQNGVPTNSSGKLWDFSDGVSQLTENRRRRTSRASEKSTSAKKSSGKSSGNSHTAPFYSAIDKDPAFSYKDYWKKFGITSSIRVHIVKYNMKNLQQGDIALNSEVSVDEFTCKGCGNQFSKMSDLKNHMRIFNCGVVKWGFIKRKKKEKEPFFVPRTLRNHGKGVTLASMAGRDDPFFSCEHCKVTFVREYGLRRHNINSCVRNHEIRQILENSGGELLRCGVCAMAFAEKQLLIDHMRTHTGGLFECDVCKKQFTNKRKYEDHKKSHNKRLLCEICGKKFSRKANIESHMQTHLYGPFDCDVRQKGVTLASMAGRDDPFFSCEHCKVTFVREYGLRRHNINSCVRNHEIRQILENSGGELLRCGVCAMAFAEKLLLIDHMRTHTGGLFECDVCKNQFPNKRKYEDHKKSHNKRLLCEICGKKFSRKANIESHMQTHLYGPFDCDVRQKKFTWKIKCTAHMKIHHKRLLCEMCGKKFSRKAHIESHMQTHIGGRCDVCQKQYTNKRQYENHKKMHNKRLLCETCGKKFPRKRYLESHMRTHTGEKAERLFACKICKKTYTVSHSLKVHMRLHTGERPFCCTICSKKFMYKRLFRQHMSSHTGNKPYACTMCEKRFIQKAHLTNHLRTHTLEKPFQCTVCEKNFSTYKGLHAHGQIHATEKPFLCDICSKGFITLSLLRSHMKNHTNYLAFQCTVCEKRFTSKYNFQKHIRRHDNVKFLLCIHCGKNFKYKASLKDHIISQHLKKSTEQLTSGRLTPK